MRSSARIIGVLLLHSVVPNFYPNLRSNVTLLIRKSKCRLKSKQLYRSFVIAYFFIQGPGEEDYYEEEDGQDADMTLLASLADAQRRQRENAAYQQLKAGGELVDNHDIIQSKVNLRLTHIRKSL